MVQIKVVEEVKTYIVCSITFFGYHSVYEEMCKNIATKGSNA
jgi:hypothetical protein